MGMTTKQQVLDLLEKLLISDVRKAITFQSEGSNEAKEQGIMGFAKGYFYRSEFEIKTHTRRKDGTTLLQLLYNVGDTDRNMARVTMVLSRSKTSSIGNVNIEKATYQEYQLTKAGSMINVKTEEPVSFKKM